MCHSRRGSNPQPSDNHTDSRLRHGLCRAEARQKVLYGRVTLLWDSEGPLSPLDKMNGSVRKWHLLLNCWAGTNEILGTGGVDKDLSN
jgi:hypothetical protein